MPNNRTYKLTSSAISIAIEPKVGMTIKHTLLKTEVELLIKTVTCNISTGTITIECNLTSRLNDLLTEIRKLSDLRFDGWSIEIGKGVMPLKFQKQS